MINVPILSCGLIFVGLRVETKTFNMKQNKIFTLLLALGVAGFMSCNDDSKTGASTDTTTNNTTAADNNTATSTNDYSAYADEIETNSAKGRYINPRTGKAYKKITVNRSTGELMDENNEPVWRYVDNENWWVYGLDDDDWTWRSMGEAKMDKDRLMYKDDSGNWVDYDKRWKTDDENMGKSWKTKSGDTKIKFSKDGDVKIKDESGKTKYDADDNKVKTDTTKK
jgi:hypothetical protein